MYTVHVHCHNDSRCAPNHIDKHVIRQAHTSKGMGAHKLGYTNVHISHRPASTLALDHISTPYAACVHMSCTHAQLKVTCTHLVHAVSCPSIHVKPMNSTKSAHHMLRICSTYYVHVMHICAVERHWHPPCPCRELPTCTCRSYAPLLVPAPCGKCHSVCHCGRTRLGRPARRETLQKRKH